MIFKFPPSCQSGIQEFGEAFVEAMWQSVLPLVLEFENEARAGRVQTLPGSLIFEAAQLRKAVDMTQAQSRNEIATLGGGCFWCLEAVFDDLKGVASVESGYMGGHVEAPTYAEVCGGRSGHAEVVQVSFDPAAVSFREILEVFFVIHDPTTRNRQGNDAGPQYRSVIFYHSPEQKAAAEQVIIRLDASGLWGRPIVTEVAPAKTFYVA